MVTLAATDLEGGGTPSDTPEQQHGSPTLPLGVGGGTLSDTAGQQPGGPPASDIAVVGGTREEGGVGPMEAVGATERWPTPEEEVAKVARAGAAGGGGNFIK